MGEGGGTFPAEVLPFFFLPGREQANLLAVGLFRDVTYATARRGLIWRPAVRRDVDTSFFRRDEFYRSSQSWIVYL